MDQLWQLFLNMVGLKWSMSGHMSEHLNCWNIRGRIPVERNGGKLSQYAFDGIFGGREIPDILKTKGNSIQKIKINCWLLFCLLCKQSYVNDAEPVIDLIEFI